MTGELTEGAVFAGKFRVLGQLGEGGMGTVYLVEQLSTHKRRALKLMRGSLASDPEAAARFAREAKVGARVTSDHIVEVVDAGVDGSSGMPWLVMEHLEGVTLADRIASGNLDRGTLDVVMRQLGHGLGAAHRAGLVHRDLKPENIFLAIPRREGVELTVKILDLGIAKLVEETAGGTGSYGFGARATGACGTPLWMAPEQLDRGVVSPAADVWALGLIAYQALTGAHYWRAARDSDSSLARVLGEMTIEPLEPASVRAGELGRAAALPPGFDAWFARCVHRDPAARFADGGAAVKAFLALGPAISVPPTIDRDALAVANTMAAATPPTELIALAQPRPAPLAATHVITGGQAPASSPPYAATQPVPPPMPPPSGDAPTGGTLAPLVGIVVGIVVLLSVLGGAAAVALWPSEGPETAPPPSVAPPVSAPAAWVPTAAAPTTPPSTGTYALPEEAACAGGDDTACVRAGVHYTEGDGVERDYMRATELYRRGCTARVGLGCTNLGYAYEAGWGVPENIDRASELYQRGCDFGDPGGCDLLGRRFLEGRGRPLDPQRALGLFERGCEGGEAAGCDELARMYERGIAVEVDLPRARGLYRRACDGDAWEGCTSYARMMSSGEGGPTDAAGARTVLERACDGGGATACNDLGAMLGTDEASPQDVVRVRELFQRACDGGEPLGCGNLGAMYRDGEGGPRDAVRANALFLQACQRGNEWACDQHAD